ncbi:MAG: ABC transporter substrate-binding protein [Myxococcota bacterium]
MSGLAWLVSLMLVGCGSNEPAPSEPAENTESAEKIDVDVEVPTVTYKLDPEAGDKSVSAELGGPGFTGEGWTTNLEISSLGNLDAPQGGQVTRALPDWPVTLRFTGKDYNTWYNYYWRSLMLMTLLQLDPVTLEPAPSLATHWQRNEDDTVFRFRINPAAMWSDGKPVVAEDFVQTYDLLVDDGILDPSAKFTWGKFERPVAVSKYILEVKVNDPKWSNFLLIATSFYPFPAHEVGELTGSEYLDQYQNKYTAVTGPYNVDMDDIVLNQTHVVKRRTDWWAEDNPAFDGRFNIGSVKSIVVKDPQLTFEKAKKGELDYFIVGKAQWWAEEIPEHPWVKRGLLYPAKFYTNSPVGTNGYALNMRREPLDDVRIRKALQYVYDRETMIEKLFFNEYEPLTSYWQYGPYQNANNEEIPFDDFKAVELLEEAGWTEKNDEGYRVKDGNVLQFEVVYGSALTERPLTQWQESAKKAGIKLDLKLLTPPSLWKTLREKQYDIANIPWGAIIFPNPDTSWLGALADQTDNNNVTSLKDDEVDRLINAYNAERDQKKREALIRELDALIYAMHPYVLSWYNPAQRVMMTNRFGFPEPWGSARFSRSTGDANLTHYWWIDPAKDEAFQKAKADDSIQLETPATHWRFWAEWSKAQNAKSAAEEPAPAEPTEDAAGE